MFTRVRRIPRGTRYAPIPVETYRQVVETTGAVKTLTIPVYRIIPPPSTSPPPRAQRGRAASAAPETRRRPVARYAAAPTRLDRGRAATRGRVPPASLG